MRKTILLVLFCGIISFAQSNRGKITGSIINKSTGERLTNANISVTPGNYGTVSDSIGNFIIRLPIGTYQVKISYIGYEQESISVLLTKDKLDENLIVKLTPTVIGQKEVYITGKKEIFSPATQKLDKIDIIRMPTIYSDVLRSIKILAGVTSDNELTSGYNVRGGNYTENLMYLDGFEIYRPFLITEGIEENQSIVNGDLVQDLNFNGGTFSARLGDKMSSALELTYKDNFDSTLSGTARAGILNSGLALFKRFGKLNLAGAVRYSYPGLFSSSFQTTGNYQPSYFDLQLIANYDFSPRSNLQLLLIGAKNKFHLTPQDWNGNFQVARFDVKQVTLKYSGLHSYSFNTALAGLKYNTELSEKAHISVLGSLYSTEEKNYEDLNSNIFYSNNAYNYQENQVYLKTNYRFARDGFNMNAFKLKTEFNYNTGIHFFETGIEANYYEFDHTVNDSMNEFGVDSVLDMPYHTIMQQNVGFPAFSGYVQDRINFSNKFQTEAGVRILRYDFSGETLVSPRLSVNYFYSPRSTINLSSGFYYQPPFYHEVSNKEIVNSKTSLKSQRAINFMLTWKTRTESGADYTVDVYYKNLNNLIPYYIDQLNLVYGSENNYEGYARGIDFQYEGDLVPGIKSWIGYSYLDTGERPRGSSGPYTRRLLDQTHTLKIFLQDRAKKHTNFQAHVRLLFGSGFLYHPRVSVRDPLTNKYYIQIDSSASWTIPFYFRTDMGITYKINLGQKTNLVLIGEVYNIFNKNNIASYNWYHVFPGTSQPVGVPVVFSSRFFSVEAEMNF